MKTYFARTAALAAIATAVACTEPAVSNEQATDLPAEMQSELEQIPTADEAESQAASKINDANVDAELERLTNDIESELDG